MKNKIIAGMIIFLVLLLAVVGVTYGYFTANVTQKNEENESTKVITTRLATATLEYGDIVESEADVYPGRKFVKPIRVTSDGGDKPVTGNITITPSIEDFGNHFKYSVYGVENPNPIDISTICSASNLIGSNGKYYDAMSCDTTSLGSVVQSGTLVHKEVTKVPIVIEGKTDRTYYVIIEYENDKENPQDSEQGKHFRIELGFEEIDLTMSEYLIALSEIDSSLVKVEHQSTEQTGTNATIDYRYTGSDPNNYVYFGCSETCTEDNLYRIIGVIPTQSSSGGTYENRVKLIKTINYEGKSGMSTGSSYTKTGKGYRWNTVNSNAWENSSLHEILNREYYNDLGEYQKYIGPSAWYLGAPSIPDYHSYTSESFYNFERSNTRGKSGGELFTVANIGLMYPSDYGYSVERNSNKMSIYENGEIYKSNAWLYNLEGKYYEWTITPEAVFTSSNNPGVWRLNPNGFIDDDRVSTAIFSIRPTFYLNSEVQYKSGKGTKEEPYHIFISK